MTFWVWLLVSLVYAAGSIAYQHKIKKLKKEMTWAKFQHIADMQKLEYEAESKLDELSKDVQYKQEILRNRLEFFSERVDRLKAIVKTLRDRQITYSVGIIKDKTPDMDIRIQQYQAREELALELQKQGAIVYAIAENFRADIDLTEIKVTATINTLKLK